MGNRRDGGKACVGGLARPTAQNTNGAPGWCPGPRWNVPCRAVSSPAREPAPRRA